jgi:glycosyltransferase involved in cell wall biosynthesis
MKVTALTLWPPMRSGTAIYSKKLYSKIGDSITVSVVPTSRSGEHSNKLLEGFYNIIRSLTHSIKIRSDVYHIQFEFLSFGHPIGIALLPLLILALKLTFTPTVITTHCILSMRLLNRLKSHRGDNIYMNLFQKNILLQYLLIVLIKSVALLSTKIIVHNRYMASILAEEYEIAPHKIAVIPHGVDKVNTSKDSANVNQKRILAFGFLRPGKGIENLLEAIPSIIEKTNQAELLVVGRGSHQQENEGDYIKQLRRLITSLGIEEHVKLLPKFVSDEELDRLIKEAGIIALLYQDYFIEASGVLCRVMDYGKPLVCTRIPKFLAELEDNVNCLFVNTNNINDVIKAVNTILRDQELAETISNRVKKLATGRYWDDVARAHVRLYEKIRGDSA